MAKSSFIERNKAVREAWNKEQELVRNRKGTRDWTPEQQKDILEKGRAYDDDGKAFEGQHMKSAEKYPEYQGDPENIQFLTRAEHLEAHDGNWQNPTNWYFNPTTKEKIDFGDGTIVPCTAIDLSNPIVKIEIASEPQPEKEAKPTQSEEKKSSDTGPPKTDSVPKTKPDSRHTAPTHIVEKTGEGGAIFKNFGHGVVNVLKKAGAFIIKNKDLIILEVIAIGKAAKTVDDIKSYNSDSKRSQCDSSRSYSSLNDGFDYKGNNESSISSDYDSDKESSIDPDYVSDNETSIGDDASEVNEGNDQETRASQNEQTVSAHSQHYNTKKGRVLIDKETYTRGGKNKDTE